MEELDSDGVLSDEGGGRGGDDDSSDGALSDIGDAAAAFAVAQALMLTLPQIGSVRASRRLHAQLSTSVLRASLGWFQATPVGRILNRFTRDTEVLDMELGQTLVQLLGCVWLVAGVLVLIRVGLRRLQPAVISGRIFVFSSI